MNAIVQRCILIVISSVLISGCSKPQPPPKPTSVPTSLPTTATAATRSIFAPQDYADVVHSHYPDLATTQPLVQPLPLEEAARLTLNEPIFCDSIGELWITQPDAGSTSEALKQADQRSTHVVRDTILFVHRWPDVDGKWQPQLIARGANGVVRIRSDETSSIGSRSDYRWANSFSWNNRIVVPSERGISVFDLEHNATESHFEFQGADPSEHAAVQAILDTRGLLAWLPSENPKSPGSGAARFVDDKWTSLDAAARWTMRIVQLVPLLDGSVMQIYIDDQGHVALSLAMLDSAAVDQSAVTKLAEQLSDPAGEQREAAFGELSRWGPGAWPILEGLLPNQPAEAQNRIRQLLESRDDPSLFGLRLLPGAIHAIARGSGGAVLLKCDAGVSIEQAGGAEPTTVTPAVIEIHPGTNVRLASAILTQAICANDATAAGIDGEWIVTDPTGPRWWIANHLTPPLLRSREMQYTVPIAIDHRGRWLFRTSPDSAAPTLILDPTLPDPTPRLPVWVFNVENGKAGSTKEGWPALERGGAWAIVDNDWKSLGRGEEVIHDNPATQSATTSPTTTSQPSETALLKTNDGTTYFGGREDLRLVHSDGRAITWPLPASVRGDAPPQLFADAAGHLFLFNSPGKLARLRITAGDAQPLKLDAVFTHNIPTDSIKRLWQDPAGRLIFLYNDNTLAICFPDGRIPSRFAEKLTAADLQAAEGTNEDSPTTAPGD